MTQDSIVHTQDKYELREAAKDFPMMVVLSFVYVCNAKCPNCPYNNSEIRASYKDHLYMADDVFKRIADECGPYASLLRISGGGEPMLHPRAVELMTYAKEKGCKIGLITNGSRLFAEQAEALIKAGVDAIEFSVDAGDEDTYALVRPGLDWETVNRNLEAAVRLRNELGADTRIITSVINQTGVDVDLAERHWSARADKVQIRKFLTWGYNEDRSADDTPYLPPSKRAPCPWLFERLNIDSRGDVTLCGEDIAFAEKFANINDRSIRDVWQGPEFKGFRELHLSGRGDQIPICSKCPDWKYRSWQYNYWKVLRDAEETQTKRKDQG
jgi:radical SAM protein with 4Fe4S-binding SPASM domain